MLWINEINFLVIIIIVIIIVIIIIIIIIFIKIYLSSICKCSGSSPYKRKKI